MSKSPEENASDYASFARHCRLWWGDVAEWLEKMSWDDHDAAIARIPGPLAEV